MSDAGLLDESDVLLSVELERSHSPYYYMSGLASNARKRGTPESKVAAIEWARQAYETSKGPATRLQWGGAYVNYLLELYARRRGANRGHVGEGHRRGG